MSEEKSPAFQFYPKDYLSSSSVTVMSLAQQGAYVRLLSSQWIEGSIPADLGCLAKICGVPIREMRKLWAAIKTCFEELDSDAGRLINLRLERERIVQRKHREKMTAAAKKAALTRWNQTEEQAVAPASTTPEPPCDRIAIAPEAQCDSMPLQFASSSAIAPVVVSIPVAEKGVAPAGAPARDSAVPTKAKRPPARFVEIHIGVSFLDRYPSLDTLPIRDALRAFLTVAEEEGRAFSAAALTQQLQLCLTMGPDRALVALQNSAQRRLLYVAEPFARNNGRADGREGRAPGAHAAIDERAEALDQATFDPDPVAAQAAADRWKRLSGGSP